jgi:phosphoribosylaminoimidazole-succinocarboxamide synthase
VAANAEILLADTKFEFGFPLTVHLDQPGPPEEHLPEWREPSTSFALSAGEVRDRLTLIDEVLTPDSSRFWAAASYSPGGPQASFDKQFVRDWLLRQAWDRAAPGPELPRDVVAGTRARYVEAFERITGASFERYLRDDVIAAEEPRR